MEKKTIYETPELQILDLETEGALCNVASGDHEGWTETDGDIFGK